MAQTTTKRTPVQKKTPATHQRSIVDRTTGVLDKTTELSDEVLKSIEAGQRAAIEALRKFADTVDGTLPHFGEGPSSRQKILDGAMEMAQQLVHTQYDFIRKVIDSTDKTLSRHEGAKPKATK
jgi:hypothetical protein